MVNVGENMKSKNKIYILISIFVFVVCLNRKIFASTNTFPRTEDDLKVKESIVVNQKVKEAALKTPKVDEKEKVYDFADLFTDEEELRLYNNITNYISKYNMDMVVVTINDNNKSSAEAYADDFYDYNDFGIGSTHDGLIFLIDMDTRNMHIATTGEAIRMYNDYRINKIQDATYSYISIKKYYDCANIFISKASSYADMGVPSGNKNTYIDENGNYIVNYGKISYVAIILGDFVFGAVVASIFVAIASFLHKTVKKATQAKHYLVKGSFNVTNKSQHFVTSSTSKVYDPPSSSGSGSGGSSTHFSSSGTCHGGSSRSF